MTLQPFSLEQELNAKPGVSHGVLRLVTVALLLAGVVAAAFVHW